MTKKKQRQPSTRSKVTEVASNQGLRKGLGFGAAFSIVVGMVIGSGIFFKPSIVLLDAGSVWMSILAWALGGAITLAAGLTMAELAAALPLTGGLYAYLEETYGRVWGFLFGWVQTTICSPGSVAALGIVFATQMSLFVPMAPRTQTLTAIGVIFLLIFGNILGSKQGGAIDVASEVPYAS